MGTELRRAFIVIGVFFLTLFVAIGYTLKLAFENHQPLLVDRYYERGLDYQQYLDGLERGRSEGWDFEAKILEEGTALSRGEQNIEVRLVNRKSAQISPKNASVRLTFDRPATTEGRREFEFSLDDARKVAGDGYAFVAAVELPRSGYWDVRLDGRINDGADVFRQARILVR